MASLRFLATLLIGILLAAAVGCGGAGGGTVDPATDNSGHPPRPDTPKAAEPRGTPIRLFGSGANIRGQPGTDDADYQEYLLWKEWQQYRKYQEWLRQQNGSAEPASQ